jgi:hypothetical protein
MPPPPHGPSVPPMTTQPAIATVRDTVEELSRRLARIGAAASSLGSLSGDIRHGVPPADLLPLLEQVERDLALASHQLEITHDRAKRELDSLRRPDRPR